MPIYKFECKKCTCLYEEIMDYDEIHNKKSLKCPKCNSKKKLELFGCPTVIFKQPAGTSKEDSFEYKAGYNMEMAKKTRQLAEERSHMGSGQEIYGSGLGDLSGKNYDSKNW